MQQYFCLKTIKIKDKLALNEEQSHHILHVLRMKDGQYIRIGDGEGKVFLASIEIKQSIVYAEIESKIQEQASPKIKITLIQGLIRKEKWEFLLQKCAEIGVHRIIPLITSRCVVKPRSNKQTIKKQRYEKILLEACEQSHRAHLVQLCDPCTIKDIATYQSECNLIAYEKTDVTQHLGSVLQTHPKVRSITIMIGCEGGFEASEVIEIAKSGFQSISLGANILRAETAAITCVANINFYYEMQGD